MDTLISNVTAVTMNEKMEVLFGAYLGVTDGKLSYIGKEPPQEQPGTIVDGTGMVAIPGLINCHTHLATAALRSYIDDLNRSDALNAQLLKEDKMDSRCAKAAAKLAIAECLRFGITSVSDLYYFPNATAEAVAETGIKANLALSAYRYIDHNEDFDFDTDEQCRELCRVKNLWHGHDDGRIRIDVGIHSEYTGNHRLWEGLLGYGSEQGLGFQLHLSQTENEVNSCIERSGLTPAQLLDCYRLFSLPTTAAGCGALTREDQALLGKRKISVVALPLSDAKSGQESLSIPGCVKAGMNVALGTDGAIASGNLDLFEVMRFAAATTRRQEGNSAALPAAAVLMMGTVCGARAQGRQETCGMLKVGMDADIALVDFSAPHLMPCHNILNGLVFSAKGGDVAMTMVRGKILYQNGKFPTIDLSQVIKDLTEYAIPRLFNSEKEDPNV